MVKGYLVGFTNGSHDDAQRLAGTFRAVLHRVKEGESSEPPVNRRFAQDPNGLDAIVPSARRTYSGTPRPSPIIVGARRSLCVDPNRGGKPQERCGVGAQA